MTTTFFSQLGAEVSAQTLDNLAQTLLRVEAILAEEVKSHTHLVQEIGELTLTAGGKRLRPALVALSACAISSQYDLERVSRIGAAMELVHMATLIHDDVIDHADRRRGRPTSFSLYGPTASILGGDVLLAKAMSILADDGDLEIIRHVSNAVVELAEGEVLEIAARGNLQLTEEEHLKILRMKTASFIECCALVGGKIAGANSMHLYSLAKYGHHLGIAFQLVDDLLDFQGDPLKTGKPIATDFREGQATLPLIYFVQARDDSALDHLLSLFGKNITVDQAIQITDALRQTDALERTADLAQWHSLEAASALQGLPSSNERTLLEAVAAFVTRREI